MDPITLGLGVASLGGQIFGAIKGGQANRANEKLLNNREAENDAYFKTKINRDFLQTNAAKGVLENVRKQYQNADKAIAGRAAITGATDEAQVAQHSANNENLNNAISSIAEGATNYQENAENQYQQSKDGFMNAKMGINSAKAQNAANLASNASNLLGTAATMGAFGGKSGALKGLKDKIVASNESPFKV